MKRLLLFLLLIPFAFAVQQWQIITGIAILTSGMILVALYLAGSMGVRELEFITHEEFYQLIMTAVMAAAIIGAATFMNDVSLGLLGDMTIQQKATQIIDSTLSDVTFMQDDAFYGPSKKIAAEGAKSAYCNFMSTGVNLATCGAYRMLTTPLSTAYQLTGMVLAELYAMKMLLNLSSTALVFFIPFGIFLRAFKFSRGAGGLLIGLGIAFYFVLPLAIVAVNGLFIENYKLDGKSLYEVDKLETTVDMSDAKSLYGFDDLETTLDIPDAGPVTVLNVPKCDEWDTGSGNLNRAKTVFTNIQPFLKQNLAVLFIRGVFLPVISLLIMVTSIRVLTALGGAEIDVSLLSKIA